MRCCPSRQVLISAVNRLRTGGSGVRVSPGAPLSPIKTRIFELQRRRFVFEFYASFGAASSTQSSIGVVEVRWDEPYASIYSVIACTLCLSRAMGRSSFDCQKAHVRSLRMSVTLCSRIDRFQEPFSRHHVRIAPKVLGIIRKRTRSSNETHRSFLYVMERDTHQEAPRCPLMT